jgi:putative ABC transport system permease protein
MFWRIIRRLLGANRGRLLVILLALGAGAAVTAALLNLQIDAKRRLTSEFRSFGPNVLITPRNAAPGSENVNTLSGQIMGRIPRASKGGQVVVTPFLYFTGAVGFVKAHAPSQIPAVIAGTDLEQFRRLTPAWEWKQTVPLVSSGHPCVAGAKLAAQIREKKWDYIFATAGFHPNLDGSGALSHTVFPCTDFTEFSSGGPEDNQMFIPLWDAQQYSHLEGRVSLIEVSVAGTPPEIESYIASLAETLPDSDVRPIRQFTEAQSKIYTRISGLLSFTVALVLFLTGLCVMAAMTNVAMERKMDVGLMKAIGGSMRRVMRLFLAEAAILGLVGGVIGAALGIILSMGLGKAVFGVAARPRLIVYPVAVVLTIIVAILSAYPLRRLASIRPASVFRGEA